MQERRGIFEVKEELARLKCAFNEGEGYRILLVPPSNKRCQKGSFLHCEFEREERESEILTAQIRL